ncbi:26S proteasome regulatory subunit [Podospora bellae-mahoneyi]|uniref:26S proteasome regulatory subunit n=1 Tax=Podospora bellae-mahoneyi TaxID=2093777 RepID=A0ABR0FFE2_9PEZI|nr:26S proteasome regulatory subunit [Podospora bellae-mahoneyi]
MNVDTISDFLAEQRDNTIDELQGHVLEFETLWERKLWHELTNKLIEFFNHPGSAPQRLQFYKVFVLKFADRINQLKLVDLALKAATQCLDNNERLAFMQSVATRVDKENSQDAHVFALIAVARVKLDLENLPGARKDLDKAESILDKFDSVETIVHSSFYHAQADYYQAKQDFGAYYKNALLYLACIDVKNLPYEERRHRAHDLAIAALVSVSIYNFGELLLHPILDALKEREEDKWLRDLVFAFNKGDLVQYDLLANQIQAHPLLAVHSNKLREKIYLAALTEAVFRRPPHDRAMSFDTIASETKVKPHEIEHLIMKALSLGLLRGTIDQVDEVAHINWVQPKVLDMTQIENMRSRLKEWDSSVEQLGNWIEKVGQDVWAA